MPSGRSPVCRRRYVGKECEVTREIPDAAVNAEPHKARPIRRSAEVAPGACREVGGAHSY